MSQNYELKIDALALVRKVRERLEDKKALNVTVLDVSAISSVADYFIVASGNSAPHLRALGDDLQFGLKKEGILCFRRAGDWDSGWVVLDYVDVIIHVFLQETREYYGIEDLWKQAPRVT